MNNRDFTAPYTYQEYPKWVTLADGTKIIANSAQEEQVLTGPAQQEADAEQEKVEEPARRRGRPPKADAEQE